jgi:hypothetical protein
VPSSPAQQRSSRTPASPTTPQPPASTRSSSHLTASSSARADVASSSSASPSEPAQLQPQPAQAQPQPLDARQLGLSDATLAELAELVEGVPIALGGSAVPSQPTRAAFADGTTRNQAPLPTTQTPRSGMASAPPQSAPASPSRVGTNPNNPFRRLASPPGSPAPGQSPLR